MGQSVCRALLTLAALAALACSGGGGNPSTPAACAQLMCNEHQVCDTSTTPARCKCQEAYTGTTCASCARGFVSVNGSCVAQVDRLQPATPASAAAAAAA